MATSYTVNIELSLRGAALLRRGNLFKAGKTSQLNEHT